MSTRSTHFIFPIILMGVGSGIFAVEVLDLGFYFVLFILLLMLGALLLVYALRIEDKLRPQLILAILFFVSVALGLGRTEQAREKFVLTSRAGEKVEIVGVVVGEPEERASYQAFVVEARLLSSDFISTQIRERVLVRADQFIDITYGDEVRISG